MKRGTEGLERKTLSLGAEELKQSSHRAFRSHAEKPVRVCWHDLHVHLSPNIALW